MNTLTLSADKALPGVNRDGQLVHCMVCYPTLAKFLRAFPQLADVEHTSGYCAQHYAEFKARFTLTNFRPAHQLN